jgi:carboxymethylenebutenolidase
MSSSNDAKQLNERPVAPIDLTGKLTIPLIGLFGNDDGNPSRDQVDRTEALLKKLGKTYELYRYDGVGHAFFNYERSGFKPEPMLDGWKQVFAFLHKHTATSRAAAAD